MCSSDLPNPKPQTPNPKPQTPNPSLTATFFNFCLHSFEMFLRRLSRSFSKALDITVIDTSSMLNGRPSAEQCRKVVEGFYEHGVIAIRDPRVDEAKNKDFLELMQRYFKLNGDRYYRGETLPDARPEVGYQVGVTPELRERARVHQSVIERDFKVNRVIRVLLANHSPAASFRWQMEILLENRRC